MSSALKAGGRRQEAEGRRQEAEGRRQEAEGRRQKAGGRRQEAGGRKESFLTFFHALGYFHAHCTSYGFVACIDFTHPAYYVYSCSLLISPLW
ncbi:MAG: CsbD family protein [Symploca sp. SIO3E6]|nr:CsbD family protein [Caldora sp. SIO3E6]